MKCHYEGECHVCGCRIRIEAKDKKWLYAKCPTESCPCSIEWREVLKLIPPKSTWAWLRGAV